MAKRSGTKIKNGLFTDIPVNILIAPVLLVFIMQAALVMMYNNNILMFSNADAYHSINKASVMVDSKFKDKGKGIPSKKEINGPVYPLLVLPFYAAFGTANLIPVLYIIDFLVLFLLGLIFYRISAAISGKETGAPASILFILSAPVALSVFSGSDVMILMVLAALNAYFCFFHIPSKKYTGYIITMLIMPAVNYAGMALGTASLAYLILALNEKAVRKNYVPFAVSGLVVVAAAVSFIMSAVFVKSFTIEALQSSGLLDTKTFMVDTFFRDGFLWSNMLPPFIGLIFFVYLVVRLYGEAAAKKPGFITYAGLVTAAGLVTEFFAVFAKDSDTMLFIPPFLFVVILLGASGVSEFAMLIKSKKGEIFTKNNILFGIMVFMIVYSAVFTYNKTIERNNNIKYITGNGYVNKFFDR